MNEKLNNAIAFYRSMFIAVLIAVSLALVVASVLPLVY